MSQQKIKGYRDLSQSELDAINGVKFIGESLRGTIAELRKMDGIDLRWVCIAETHLQQGIMAAVRAIAKPTTF